MTEERCGICRFWELSEYAKAHGLESGTGGYHCSGDYSRCRRHAPTFRTVENRGSDFAGAGTTWPYTARDDWCGDYEPR